MKSSDHRGTVESPGRVATLVRSADLKAEVFGVCYELPPSPDPCGENVDWTFLDTRERHGYTRTVVTVRDLAGREQNSQVYFVDEESVRSIPEEQRPVVWDEDPDKTATVIATARGPSGTNVEYLRRMCLGIETVMAENHILETARDDYLDALRGRVEALVQEGSSSSSSDPGDGADRAGGVPRMQFRIVAPAESASSSHFPVSATRNVEHDSAEGAEQESTAKNRQELTLPDEPLLSYGSMEDAEEDLAFFHFSVPPELNDETARLLFGRKYDSESAWVEKYLAKLPITRAKRELCLNREALRLLIHGDATIRAGRQFLAWLRERLSTLCTTQDLVDSFRTGPFASEVLARNKSPSRGISSSTGAPKEKELQNTEAKEFRKFFISAQPALHAVRKNIALVRAEPFWLWQENTHAWAVDFFYAHTATELRRRLMFGGGVVPTYEVYFESGYPRWHGKERGYCCICRSLFSGEAWDQHRKGACTHSRTHMLFTEGEGGIPVCVLSAADDHADGGPDRPVGGDLIRAVGGINQVDMRRLVLDSRVAGAVNQEKSEVFPLSELGDAPGIASTGVDGVREVIVAFDGSELEPEKVRFRSVMRDVGMEDALFRVYTDFFERRRKEALASISSTSTRDEETHVSSSLVEESLTTVRTEEQPRPVTRLFSSDGFGLDIHYPAPVPSVHQQVSSSKTHSRAVWPCGSVIHGGSIPASTRSVSADTDPQDPLSHSCSSSRPLPTLPKCPSVVYTAGDPDGPRSIFGDAECPYPPHEVRNLYRGINNADANGIFLNLLVRTGHRDIRQLKLVKRSGTTITAFKLGRSIEYAKVHAAGIGSLKAAKCQSTAYSNNYARGGVGPRSSYVDSLELDDISFQYEGVDLLRRQADEAYISEWLGRRHHDRAEEPSWSYYQKKQDIWHGDMDIWESLIIPLDHPNILQEEFFLLAVWEDRVYLPREDGAGGAALENHKIVTLTELVLDAPLEISRGRSAPACSTSNGKTTNVIRLHFDLDDETEKNWRDREVWALEDLCERQMLEARHLRRGKASLVQIYSPGTLMTTVIHIPEPAYTSRTYSAELVVARGPRSKDSARVANGDDHEEGPLPIPDDFWTVFEPQCSCSKRTHWVGSGAIFSVP